MSEERKEDKQMDNKYKMPADINAEKAVLGAMLYDNAGLNCGLGCLKSDDFYYLDNQKIFDGIKSVYDKGKIVDYVTVSAELEGAVDVSYIINLFTSTCTSAGIKHYCNILLDLSYRRRSILKAQKILEAAESNDNEKLNKAIDELKDESAGAADTETVPAILEQALIDVAELRKSGRQIAGYATGFYDLDEILSGLEKKMLFVIAGRPAMGKSSAALNICYAVARNNQDKNVAFFSLEMPKKSVAMRIYSAALNISNEHFKFNMLTADELSKISEFTEKFSSETSNFYIEDDMNMSIYDIQSSCRNIKNKSNKDFALIAIDYLQIIKIASNGNRAMDLGEISRICVLMSKEFDCPVILLSQVNRGCEARQNKRPMLSDLKESGNIEQDADTVIFVYRDEMYDKNSKDKNTAEFIVAKQRNGATGTIKLGFRKQTSSFYNIYRR